MKKTILITGATDGIGLETAKILIKQGHHLLLHGRNHAKMQKIESALSPLGSAESYIADLSNRQDVLSMVRNITHKHRALDVLINNAGVLQAPDPVTEEGIDIRFAVNVMAPYMLTNGLLELLQSRHGRVVNLSSAAQSSVDLDALSGKRVGLEAMAAYAQSKLAITMWSRRFAQSHKEVTSIAVNPGSLLASKMVKEGFGIEGKDINIGADILARLAVDDSFKNKSGCYFDNDAGQFVSPHLDALDDDKCDAVLQVIDTVCAG